MDFDIEDWSIFGGLSEEFADDFKREYYVQRERIYEHCEDHKTDNYLKRVKKTRRHKRPFEQYVDDIIHGVKTYDDPIVDGYDIYRRVLFPKANKDISELSIASVKIFNSHLVSKDFLNIVHDILLIYNQNNIDSIRFDCEGAPVVNGKPVLGTYCPNSKRIEFNLRRHFENAIAVSKDIQLHYSIRTLIWNSLLFTFLHEIHHNLSIKADPFIAEKYRQTEELKADEWSRNQLTKIARLINIEPPSLINEPYFCPLFNQFVKRLPEKECNTWFQHQKVLLDANLMYWHPQKHAAILTMKDYYLGSEKKQSKANADNPSAVLQEEAAKMHKFVENYKNARLALKEAIKNGFKLKIQWLDKDRQIMSDTIQPLSFFYQNGIEHIKGISIADQSSISFRIDMIQNIVFSC